MKAATTPAAADEKPRTIAVAIGAGINEIEARSGQGEAIGGVREGEIREPPAWLAAMGHPPR